MLVKDLLELYGIGACLGFKNCQCLGEKYMGYIFWITSLSDKEIVGINA